MTFFKHPFDIQIISPGYWFLLFVVLAVQIVSIITTDSIVVAVIIAVVLCCTYIYINNVQDFSTFLLLLTIVPFVYIEHRFSRHFGNIVLQNLPLAVLFIYFVFHIFYGAKNTVLRLNYLFLPIIIYTLISFVLSLYGLLQNFDNRIIIEELYQNFYFIFAIPIFYLLSRRSNYMFLFKLIIFIFTLIAIQYIVIDLIYPYRFTSYHNHFFPVTVALLFAAILFINGKSALKFILLIDLVLIWAGSVATGTRMLWVSNLVAMIIVLILYLKTRRYRIRYLLILILAAIPILIFFIRPQSKINFDFKNVTTEQRLQSISDPLTDLSFLMRVETVYLSIQEIIQNPIIGYGFGHQLQMQWLLKTKYTFPDNNYLYYWLKGGIIFLFVALWMFYRLLRVQFFLFNNSNSINVKLMMAALIAGIISLMIFALMNANLVKLKLNILYALIFAYVAYEKKIYERHNQSIIS